MHEYGDKREGRKREQEDRVCVKKGNTHIEVISEVCSGIERGAVTWKTERI